MSSATEHEATLATHYCAACGAFWRQNDDLSMSLRYGSIPCKACDNGSSPPYQPLFKAPNDAERARALEKHIADIMRSWAGSNGGVFTINACAAEIARFVTAEREKCIE